MSVRNLFTEPEMSIVMVNSHQMSLYWNTALNLDIKDYFVFVTLFQASTQSLYHIQPIPCIES